jgi:hypothetical protein
MHHGAAVVFFTLKPSASRITHGTLREILLGGRRCDDGSVRSDVHRMMPDNDADVGRSNAQIQRLAASAAELGRSIRRANALPPRFPENELLGLADALEDTPGADVQARLAAGLYVRERFVEVRRQFVSEAPDDPDMPGIDAIAHCLNDTIAELSTLVVAAGTEAEKRARPDRATGTSVVATNTAGVDAVNLQSASDRTTEDIQQLETALRSVPVNVHIDQSRHYQLHFLNFSNSIKQLKFSVKITGALFRGEFLDRAWLDKLTAALEGARAKFSRAWEAARRFLGQISSIVDAVQRVSRDAPI